MSDPTPQSGGAEVGEDSEATLGAYPDDYPPEWDTHAVLSDGATVEIRPILPSDREALDAFHRRQSKESIYFRFFRHRPELTDRELEFFTHVDYKSRMAFVAFDSNELVAVARYEFLKEERHKAEVAFFVDDQNHGRGLATLLLEYLAAAARANDLTHFTASVLPENYRMLGVFRAAGFETSTRFADGIIDVDIDLAPTPASAVVIDNRRRQSVTRSMRPLVDPDVIAVVGASRRPGALGHELLRGLVGQGRGPGFEGTVFAVNPNADTVCDHPAHPSVMAAASSIESAIDLAVVAVPAHQVAGVVDDCGAAGVRGLLIITAGFGDQGIDGLERQNELVRQVWDHGMRLIGPNAFGLANTATDGLVNLLSVPIDLMPGPVALASDSGLLAAAVMDQLRLAGIGISQVVGVGNQADVSVADLVIYWASHEPTKVIVLYTERLSVDREEVKALADAARLASRVKPIVSVRPADDVTSQLLADAGVILVDAVSELADQAVMLGSQPVPRGDRVAIVSNSASLARLSQAACRRYGLTVSRPASVAQGSAGPAILVDNLDQVSEVFGLTVAVSQSGSVADYESVIVATGVDHQVDAVILALVPTDDLPLAELERLADRVNRSVDKPFAVVGLYDRSGVSVDQLPFYTFPDEAASALGRSVAYGRWRRFSTDQVEVSEPTWIDEVLGDTGLRLLSLADTETATVLSEIGLPMASYAVGSDLAEVEAAANRVGYPIVLKLANLDGGWIGESGGAAIDIHNAQGLIDAYERMFERWGAALTPAVVQTMVPHNLMTRVDLFDDGQLGPSVSIGLAGSTFDGVQPLGRAFLPTSEHRLIELVEALSRQVAPDLLSEEAAAELFAIIQTVAELGAANAGLQRLSLNPILLTETGAVPVDIAIALHQVDVDPLNHVRRLTPSSADDAMPS